MNFPTSTLRGALALPVLLALGACSKDKDPTMPAEPTTFEVTVENVSMAYAYPSSGVFSTPIGEAGPGPLFPGGKYEFDFVAPPGASLSLATMMVQSNDFFYAPDGGGIALWSGGSQVTGDVTDQLLLWDAGSEADQEPGLGADQAPRQAGPDTGADDPDDTVRMAADSYGNLPAVSDVIKLTLESTGPYSWRARIENVSSGTTLMTSDGASHPVPMSPGVFVVHTDADPLFTAGSADRGEGLAAIAEDGAAGDLGGVLADRTGLTGVLSPGAWALHTGPSVIFASGTPDRGEGLEGIAEDGSPAALASSLATDPAIVESGAFDTPNGAASPGPATPGASYTFTFTAEEGDRLTFATMFAQSNDLFFAPSESGIDLFRAGEAISGDITGQILLWDAGTEVNERPGVGMYQAPRQAGPNTGPTENGDVRPVADGYDYGAVSDVIRVTITPGG